MISMIFLSKVFLLSIAKLSLIFSLACFINAETSGIVAFSSPSTTLRGCLFPAFRHFFISFREIQKLDGLKSEKLEAPFHELPSFSLLGQSNFWISRKLFHKSDKKLKQTPPKYNKEWG
jgi:hypothetical protein